MQPKKHRSRPGFVLLEAVVFVTLMLVFGAALLATTYNSYKNSMERTQNNRAYYAAVTALKLVGNDLATKGTSSLFYPTTASASETRSTYSMWVQTPDEVTGGKPGREYAAVRLAYKPTGFVPDSQGNALQSYTATATVLDETEVVSMTVQKIQPEAYPHTLFGAGFAGWIDPAQAQGLTLTLGADTDLYLYGYTTAHQLLLKSASLGGNVILQDAQLTLEDGAVGGSLVGGSGSIFTLKNTVVGGGGDAENRLSNLYTTGQAQLLQGSVINGSVYANKVYASGQVNIKNGGSIFSGQQQLDQQVVLGKDGTPHHTTESTLARRGTVSFEGGAGTPGRWQTLGTTPLEDPLASPTGGNAAPLFRPNFPANMATHVVASTTPITPLALTKDGLLYKVPDGQMLVLSSAPDLDGAPAIFVQLGKDSTLMLEHPGTYALCVYGEGTEQAAGSTVKVASGSTIIGSLQGVQLDVMGNNQAPLGLTINYVQPTLVQFQAPASAGFAKTTYQVLEFKRSAPTS